MTIQRSTPPQEDALEATVETRQDYPADAAASVAPGPRRVRPTHRQRRTQQRDAAVSHQLWESLAQRMAGVSYLAEAMAERLKLIEPAESQRAKHIAELAADAVREACQLARTLAPYPGSHSLK